MQRVIDDSGNPLRHRIEHNAVLRPDMRHRYDEAGAVVTIFGAFATCAFLGLDERFRFITPEEFQRWEWPWRDVLDLNPATHFGWHGDFPVFADSSPLGSLYGFVTRRQILADGTVCEPEPFMAEQAISVEEALRLMTIGAAYALDRDTEIGSLTPGKLGDLVVLSADPTATQHPEELRDLSVELTVLDGQAVFCDGAFDDLCGDQPNGVGSELDTELEQGMVSASSSLPTNPPAFAFDGDLETHWGAGAFAPQWLEVEFGQLRTISELRLVTDQSPAGYTRHVILGRDRSGALVELGAIEGETDMAETLTIEADPPWEVTSIRIETTDSPSWVSWKEVDAISAN
jgi:hypothetical protein